jgi:uncharacterized protein
MYLLDVNALVALGFANHQFHDRVASWVSRRPTPKLATCSITELGFVRVLTQAPAYGLTIAQARTLLGRMKEADVSRFTFLLDDHNSSHLPTWVKTPKQITDGDLVELVAAKGCTLATLNEKIPGASDTGTIGLGHARVSTPATVT